MLQKIIQPECMCPLLLLVLLLIALFVLMLMVRRRPMVVVESMDNPDAMWDSLDKAPEADAAANDGGGGGAATAAAVAALGAKIDQVGVALQQLTGPVGKLDAVATNMEKVAGAVEGNGGKLDAISTNMEKVAGAMERVAGMLEPRLDSLVTHIGTIAKSLEKTANSSTGMIQSAMSTPGMPKI